MTDLHTMSNRHLLALARCVLNDMDHEGFEIHAETVRRAERMWRSIGTLVGPTLSDLRRMVADHA